MQLFIVIVYHKLGRKIRCREWDEIGDTVLFGNDI
jgi:hypothetical protein